MSAQLPLELAHRVAMDRASFLPARCNRDALAWLDRWPQWPSSTLVLYGPSGCGKTHLASIWAERAQARWLERPPALGARSRADHTFVLDDADRRLHGRGDEVALLQFYNWVTEQRGYLLLTARSPASRWRLGLADLISRLRAAPAVAIGAPDDALLGEVLAKLFGDRQLSVSDEVIRYMLVHMERSFAAARTLVAALDVRSLAQHRAITIPLVRSTLEQINQSDSVEDPASNLGGP